MQRRCYDGRGRGWQETCTLWDEGRRYTMRVQTETYPFPLRQLFREFEGRWEVEADGEATVITMRFDTRLSPLGRRLRWPIRRAFSRQCERLLDNWQSEIERRPAARALGAESVAA